MSKQNVLMNEKFYALDEETKLAITNARLLMECDSRFRGLEQNVVVSDLWSNMTNSKKRRLLKKHGVL